jgi:outer membrane protein TolC
VVDLSRSIENNLPKLADAIRQLRAEWQQRQEAVVQYEATWAVAQQLRDAGDMTLIDTLLTEQQLTQARLQLVQAKRDYASAVARFRRETGTIVDFTDWSRGRLNLVGVVMNR